MPLSQQDVQHLGHLAFLLAACQVMELVRIPDEVVKIALTRELPGQAELDSIVGDKDFSSAFENKETASEAIKH